ncbi:hypothetical protein BH18GEM1_BH18GEM1_00010 [soil metagenome]
MRAGFRYRALWIGLAVCAACGERTRSAGVRPGAPRTATVRIVNWNWSDMRVYAARDGDRSLLGLVTTGATQTFPLPADLMGRTGELRLVADPVGSAILLSSEPFLIDHGQVVEWTIHDRPENSTIVVH